MDQHQETIADVIAWLRRPREGENGYLTLWRDEIADRLEAAHRRERGDAAKLREVLKRIVAASIVAKNANAPEWILQRMADIFAMATTALSASPRNCDAHTTDPDWKDICAKCMDGDIEPHHCEYYGEPNGCNSPIYGEHPSTPNAVAMHACLLKILAEMIDLGGMEAGRKAHFSPDAIAEEIRQAFAVPPRNCDRFKTAAEAIDAYQDLTGDQLATDSGMKEWTDGRHTQT